MTGHTVYESPQGHICAYWAPDGPLGSVWRCDVCGAYWRHEPVALLRAGGWYPLRGIALWRWKRHHPAEAAR